MPDAADREAVVNLFGDALAIQRQTLPATHLNTALTLTQLARLLLQRGRPRDAEALAREAVELTQAALPAGHHRRAEARAALAAAHAEPSHAAAD